MQKSRRTFIRSTLLAPSLFGLGAAQVFAQTQQSAGPLRFIIPYSPGSGSDTIALTAAATNLPIA